MSESKRAEPTEPLRSKDFGFLPIPKPQRHDPAHEFPFTTLLNIIFGVTSTFTIANLYYCQPILIELAESFGVTNDQIANVPTLTQSGYATGLLFIAPLGDMVRRRGLLMAIIFCAGTLTIGLALTQSLAAFEALSFLIGIVSVTPQILLPFAADLAPPHRRGSALAIVIAGLLLGVLVARLLSGIIAQFSSWRNVYWMSVGLHYAILLALYFVLPDFPHKNLDLSYFQILYSMGKFVVTEPVLVQSCLIGLCGSTLFGIFWVTLTFLLGGPPYNYETLDIGLFALVGILGVVAAPFIGIYVDRLEPWFGTLIGLCGMLVGTGIYTGGASLSIGAVVVPIFVLDVSMQMQQVSNAVRNFAINPAARSRINSVFIIAVFLGQVMGASAGAKVFTSYGPRATVGLMMGYCGFAIAVLLARGPAATGWVGWTRDWRWTSQVHKPTDTEKAEGGDQVQPEPPSTDADLAVEDERDETNVVPDAPGQLTGVIEQNERGVT